MPPGPTLTSGRMMPRRASGIDPAGLGDPEWSKVPFVQASVSLHVCGGDDGLRREAAGLFSSQMLSSCQAEGCGQDHPTPCGDGLHRSRAPKATADNQAGGRLGMPLHWVPREHQASDILTKMKAHKWWEAAGNYFLGVKNDRSLT